MGNHGAPMDLACTVTLQEVEELYANAFRARFVYKPGFEKSPQFKAEAELIWKVATGRMRWSEFEDEHPGEAEFFAQWWEYFRFAFESGPPGTIAPQTVGILFLVDDETIETDRVLVDEMEFDLITDEFTDQDFGHYDYRALN